MLNGQLNLDDVKKPVKIERDTNGLPSLYASNREDSAFALGFLHSQERFFQMDLLRRTATGGLSALIGHKGIESDKQAALFKFENLAKQVVNNLPASHQALLHSYSAGVNQGLQQLNSLPFEYKALKLTPKKWQEHDSILVVYALFMRLQGQDMSRLVNRQILSEALTPELFAFLLPESQLHQGKIPQTKVPGPEIWNTREYDLQPPTPYNPDVNVSHRPSSTGWVTSNKYNRNTTVVADINLNLEMPNMWFRAIQVISDGQQVKTFNGITLPGFPLFFSGTNNHVAWGISLSKSNWSYLLKKHKTETPAQTRQVDIEVHQEGILSHVVNDTPWGPVVAEEDNFFNVWRWVANSPFSINMGLLELESATSTEEVLNRAAQSRIPHMDVFVGDTQGNVGWTLMGAIPMKSCLKERKLCLSNRSDFYNHSHYPHILNPSSGHLSVADVPYFDVIAGTHHHKDKMWLGQRQKQIKDNLFVMYRPDQYKVFNSLVDKRNQSMLRWQQFMLNVLNEQLLTEHPNLNSFRRLVDQWNGDASPNSAGYLLIRAFKERVAEYVFKPIFANKLPANLSDDISEYFFSTEYWEQSLWLITEQQPEHFLDPQFTQWRNLYGHIVLELDQLFKEEHGSLDQAIWGKYNQVHFEHVLSSSLSYLNNWLLALPNISVSGDTHLPKTQLGNFGATLRLVISPDNHADSLLSMPFGQASTPLSPYWRSGHDDWMNEKPVPLLPGKPQFKLTLNPKQMN
ncbi:penicillin acylase family protein [Shewanella waksmanii]|uniref:penicillin acylase family protein n=1 Tax=Shewanella waksmanii TaxID=213783 RepID=UPI003734FFF1